jgi:hypothetical protein
VFSDATFSPFPQHVKRKRRESRTRDAHDRTYIVHRVRPCARSRSLAKSNCWYDVFVNGAHDIELERQVLRLNRRYLDEVVEAFALCPWALRARLDGQVSERVFAHESPEFFAESLDALGALSERETIEVGLFIYPRLRLSRLEFEHFVRRLRALDEARYEVGEVPLAMAAFHPDAEPDLDDAERLIPYLRRSPYPTIQVVRRAALDRVRGGADEGTAYLDLSLVASLDVHQPVSPPLRERIARANLATVRRVGKDTLEAAFRDILRDRDETEERLARDKRA